MEEAAADLKMNSTLFVPEQSISGGGVGVGGGENTCKNLLVWKITWENFLKWGGGVCGGPFTIYRMMLNQLFWLFSGETPFDAYHPITSAAIKPNTSLNRKYSEKLVSSFNFQTHTCLEIPSHGCQWNAGKNTSHTGTLWVSEAITHLMEQRTNIWLVLQVPVRGNQRQASQETGMFGIGRRYTAWG